MKNKKFNLKEAIDVGGVPQFFDPGKKRKIEQGVPELEPILPSDLTPAAQRYLEYIASESYKTVLRKVQHYTGRDPAQMNLPGVIGEVMAALNQIIKFEAAHTKELTELAVDIVLSLPEFYLAKIQKDQGFLKIEAKLGKNTTTLQDANQAIEATEIELEMDDQPENEGDITPVEELDREIAENFSDAELRRKLGRVLFQGNAINKFYVFNLLKHRLDEINPRLNNLYGVASAYIHLLYYAQPETPYERDYEKAEAAGAVQGSCQVIANNDGTYTIKSAGITLPFLIHELVKCIFEYFIVDLAPQTTLDKQELGDEQVEFLCGPQAYTLFTKYIPRENKDYHLIPLIYQKFLRLHIAEIKTVMAGKENAKPIIDRLVHDSRREMNEYEEAVAERERENATDEFRNSEKEPGEDEY